MTHEIACGEVCRDLLTNIVANIVCILVPLGLAHFLYRRGRGRLRRFFGLVARGRDDVRVFLSNLRITGEYTISRVKIDKQLVGSAILAGEYRYALELASVFHGQAFLGSVYEILEQFGARGILAPISCTIGPSPQYDTSVATHPTSTQSGIDFTQAERDAILRILAGEGPLILVGSPVYNLLTAYVMHENASDESAGVEFGVAQGEGGQFASAVSVQRGQYTFERHKVCNGGADICIEYFLLQRLVSWRGKRTIFVCAGTSLAATAAALAKLADWRHLAAEHAENSFTTVYELRTRDRELTSDAEPSQIKWDTHRVWPRQP